MSDQAAGVMVRVPVLAVPIDGEDVAVSDLIDAYRQVSEATKTVGGKARPAGDFLVVEDSDKPTTWHLPVKVNGKPDHRLMGGAWAALHKGYRGNKYEGPGKAAALTKLKALYKSEDMPLPAGEFDFSEAVSKTAVRQVLGFLLEQMGEEAEEVAEAAEEEMAEVELAESAGLDADGNAPVGSAVIGRIIDFQERKSDDEPAYLDLVPVSPGWGNARDNNYYDLPILCKFAHVWNGAKMWATDHKRADKNALNQISEVVKSPVGYTDDGVPIARAVILNPEFEEVVRRRKAAGRLHTLHCSILAEGKALKKPYKKDNRTGKYVISIAKENAGIDWVTRAGAGGHALNLAETADGGNDMSDKDEKEEKEQEVPVLETQEAVLSEAGQEKPETPARAGRPKPLEGDAVKALLRASTLPEAAQKRLAEAEYKDEAEVKTAITAEVDYLKTITGSGKPFGQGGGRPPEETRISEADMQKKFDAIDRQHGLYVAEEVE